MKIRVRATIAIGRSAISIKRASQRVRAKGEDSFSFFSHQPEDFSTRGFESFVRSHFENTRNFFSRGKVAKILGMSEEFTGYRLDCAKFYERKYSKGERTREPMNRAIDRP